MTTVTTPPPPTAPTPPSAPQGGPEPRTSSRVIAILALVFGGLVVLGTLLFAALGTASAAAVRTTSDTVGVAGVERLDVVNTAGSLRVEFADVATARLDVTAGPRADEWTLERDGDTLRVAAPDWRWNLWWNLGDFGWGDRGESRAVLTLPDSLADLEATVSSDAGDLRVDGDFESLGIRIGAGSAEVSGTVGALDVDLNAGRADISVARVDTAHVTVNAGRLALEMAGSQPDEITADVAAGSLTLVVPGGDYDVTSEVAAGDFDNRVGSTPGADSTVHVEVAAGNVTLRSGR